MNHYQLLKNNMKPAILYRICVGSQKHLSSSVLRCAHPMKANVPIPRTSILFAGPHPLDPQQCRLLSFWRRPPGSGSLSSMAKTGMFLVVGPCVICCGALSLPLMAALGLGGYALLGTRPGRAMLGMILEHKAMKRLLKYQRRRRGPNVQQNSFDAFPFPFGMGLPFFRNLNTPFSSLPFVSGPFQGLLGFFFNSAVAAMSNQQQTMDHLFRSIVSGLAKNSQVLQRFGGMVTPKGATKFSQSIVNGQSRVMAEFMVVGKNGMPGTIHVSAVGSQLPNDHDALRIENMEVSLPETGEVFNITGSSKQHHTKQVVDTTFRVKKK